jgi:replicative DNA helicase
MQTNNNLLIFATELKISLMTEKDELIQKIERIIGNEKLSEREVLQQIKELYDAQMQAMCSSTAIPLPELFSKWAAKTAVAEDAISSGFSDLDQLMDGFLTDEFVVVGGRPAMGKTQLLINFALHISKNAPALFLSYGISEQLIVSRFLASISNIESQKIAHKKLSNSELKQLEEKIALFHQHQLFIDSHPETDIDILKAHCIRKIEEEHIKVILIDCIQSLNSMGRHYRNRDAVMSYICKELKKLAMEHHVCVIVASNLNRSVENRASYDGKRPQLSDLRDSGSIEQEADKVIFLHRLEYYKILVDEQGNDLTGIAELIVAKNSSGALGNITLKRTEGFTNFVDFHFPKNLDEITFPKNRLDEIENTYPF